jgi:hypothetical protein
MRRNSWWIIALGIMVPVAIVRALSQMGGSDLVTNMVPIVGRMAINLSIIPVALQTLIEMVCAVFAVSGLVYLIQRINKRYGIAWALGMIIAVIAWSTDTPIVWLFLGIGGISFAFAVRIYGAYTEVVWCEVEKGIVGGCLVGASLHYGFMIGCQSVAVVWAVQEWGTQIGALVGLIWERMTEKEEAPEA